MKKFQYILLAVSTVCLFSCAKETPIPEETQSAVYTFTCTFAKPDVKVSISDQGKTQWEAGDEILVHGNGYSSAVVKLQPSDISIDGKVATISVSEVEPRDGYFYAQYPAWASPEGFSFGKWCVFNNTDAFLMGARSEDDRFVFYNLSGVIAYQVYGDFDQVEFCGNNDEAVAYSDYEIRVPEFRSYTDGPGVSIWKSIVADGATVNYLYLPGGVNFSGGFTFRFYSRGELKQMAISTKPIEVGRNQFLNLGDITWRLEEYVPDSPSDHQSSITDARDLSSLQANCFVISEPGAYKFPAFKGISQEPLDNYVHGADVLWESWNNLEEVTPGSIVAEMDFQDEWIYFRTPDVLTPGNAVIAARNLRGQIIWSWHIWVPGSEITHDSYGNLYKTHLMDRDLGALYAPQAETVNPIESFGLTYQWGRKDPFPGPGEIGRSTPASVAGMETQCDMGRQLTLKDAIAQPTLMGQINDGNWLVDSDDWLWQDDVKTIYDPCPAGWRVPAYDTSCAMMQEDLSTVTGWGESEEFHYFTLGEPAAVFPLGGYRDDYGPLSYSKMGYRVEYWLGSTYANNSTGKLGNAMRVRTASSGNRHQISGVPKARGCYIRCVAE